MSGRVLRVERSRRLRLGFRNDIGKVEFRVAALATRSARQETNKVLGCCQILLIAGLQGALGGLEDGEEFTNQKQRAGDQHWIVEMIGKV